MTFEIPVETNAGKIVDVTIGATSEQGGTRSHTVTIGGSGALPFHFFEGEHPYRLEKNGAWHHFLWHHFLSPFLK